MNIAVRMKKVREVMGWQQATVASSMQISQQAFSFLEQGSGSIRIDFLSKFCEVMNVQLHYLMAVDVPVTRETLEKYGSISFSQFIADHDHLQQGLSHIDRMVSARVEPSIPNLTKSNAI
jgi:transcriptional regulator with XRE-family HTH domain